MESRKAESALLSRTIKVAAIKKRTPDTIPVSESWDSFD